MCLVQLHSLFSVSLFPKITHFPSGGLVRISVRGKCEAEKTQLHDLTSIFVTPNTTAMREKLQKKPDAYIFGLYAIKPVNPFV